MKRLWYFTCVGILLPNLLIFVLQISFSQFTFTRIFHFLRQKFCKIGSLPWTPSVFNPSIHRPCKLFYHLHLLIFEKSTFCFQVRFLFEKSSLLSKDPKSTCPHGASNLKYYFLYNHVSETIHKGFMSNLYESFSRIIWRRQSAVDISDWNERVFLQ